MVLLLSASGASEWSTVRLALWYWHHLPVAAAASRPGPRESVTVTVTVVHTVAELAGTLVSQLGQWPWAPLATSGSTCKPLKFAPMLGPGRLGHWKRRKATGQPAGHRRRSHACYAQVPIDVGSLAGSVAATVA